LETRIIPERFNASADWGWRDGPEISRARSFHHAIAGIRDGQGRDMGLFDTHRCFRLVESCKRRRLNHSFRKALDLTCSPLFITRQKRSTYFYYEAHGFFFLAPSTPAWDTYSMALAQAVRSSRIQSGRRPFVPLLAAKRCSRFRLLKTGLNLQVNLTSPAIPNMSAAPSTLDIMMTRRVNTPSRRAPR
jgi:hypothetical protein